jgi:hypothetical protein
MKYVISWEARAGTTEDDQKRGLAVFSKWSPSPNATFKEFVGTIDGRGGYAFVETDDPNTVLRDASIFGAWFDFTVHPVVDIAETARIAAEAIEFRDSVS